MSHISTSFDSHITITISKIKKKTLITPSMHVFECLCAQHSFPEQRPWGRPLYMHLALFVSLQHLSCFPETPFTPSFSPSLLTLDIVLPHIQLPVLFSVTSNLYFISPSTFFTSDVIFISRSLIWVRFIFCLSP